MRKRMLKKKRIFLILGILALLFVVLFMFNKWTFRYKGIKESQLHVEYKGKDASEDVSCYFTGTLFPIIRIPVKVGKIGRVDTSKIDEYPIKYYAKFFDFRDSKKVTFLVEDTTPPTISLKGSKDSYTVYGQPYEEEGFIAIDRKDGDLTDQVEVEEKDGVVYYTVTDSSGNVGKAERKLRYDDRKGPEIIFADGADVEVLKNAEFKDSFTAVDDYDGDVTDQVTVEGEVDTSTPGEYTLKYTVKDTHDNETTSERTVTVLDQTANVDTGTIDEAYIVYLTFDDGPGPYTDRLLGILKKYNVKATFFTTSAYEDYLNCIAKEAEDGHTVAVHTYTHAYDKIYTSTDAYWADFDSQNKVIKQQTGSATTLFRFPGGSSNAISASYSKGIMTKLVEQSEAKGYAYYDWNISSGDAGETTDTQTVVNNVIDGIKTQSSYGCSSIVLQHDIKDFSVDAVEEIIKWGLENGYSFRALTPDSPKAHHAVSN